MPKDSLALGDALGFLGVPRDSLGIREELRRDFQGFLKDSVGIPRDFHRIPRDPWGCQIRNIGNP